MGRALGAVAALALGLGTVLAFARAQADAELKRLEAALGRINQAQQSLHEQFQMVQELRRAELARPDPFAPQPNRAAVASLLLPVEARRRATPGRHAAAGQARRR